MLSWIRGCREVRTAIEISEMMLMDQILEAAVGAGKK